MEQLFIYDDRLRISIPHLPRPFDSYTLAEQTWILSEWENQRGSIPDRIKELENYIDHHLYSLNHEDDFEASCRLNHKISQLASTINDLWIWYRTNPTIQTKQQTN